MHSVEGIDKQIKNGLGKCFHSLKKVFYFILQQALTFCLISLMIDQRSILILNDSCLLGQLESSCPNICPRSRIVYYEDTSDHTAHDIFHAICSLQLLQKYPLQFITGNSIL